MKDWFDSPNSNHPRSLPLLPRRQALRTVAVASVAALLRPANAAAPAGDAALLDLCHRFDADSRAMREYDRLRAVDEPTMSEAELNDLMGRWHDTLGELIDLPAKTAAGIRAKAGAQGNALMQAVMTFTGQSFEDQAEDYELLAMSLVRDIAPMSDVPCPLVHAPLAAPGPDAELFARCGETTELRAAMNAVVEAMMGLSFPEAEKLEPDLDRATAAYFEAVDLIATIPAVSRAGVLAKAAILRESIEEEVGICGGEVMGDRQHKLAWSLTCDLATVAG